MNKETTTLISEAREVEEKKKTEEGGFRGCLGARHVLALMAFLGLANVYSLRVCLSVALVAMVNYTDSSSSSSLPNDDQCPDPYVGNSSVPDREGEFLWDEVTQGNILGAFYYGYLITQIPGGWLADSRLGGKRVFGFGILFTAALTLLTPLAARSSVTLFIALRVLEGIFEGVSYPGLNALLGRWVPAVERSKLVPCIHAGWQPGTIIAMSISGFLCDSHWGWPSVFYVFGGLGCLWFVAWMALIHETPAEHPRISKAERDYIESCVGKKEEVPTPWKKILTSSALWGIAAAHFTLNWDSYILLSCLPIYFKVILKFNIKENGLISGLPYILSWLIQIIASFLSDYLGKHNYLSTKNNRKLFTVAGLAAEGAFLIAVGLVGCDHTLVMVFFSLAVGFGAIINVGLFCNHLDIAPRFAGVLMGITNAVATTPGFLGPALAGLLTNHNETLRQWQLFFYITAAISFTGAAVFCIFARGEEQSWGGVPPMSLEIEPQASPDHLNRDHLNHINEHVVLRKYSPDEKQ